MRQIVVTRFGGPEVLELQPAPRPAPGRDELLIHNVAIGVNFGDIQRRRGPYHDAPVPPYVPGFEVAGTVAAVGAGVARELRGRRIAAFTEHAYAEFATARAQFAYLLPEPVGFERAAAALVAGVTAETMIRRSGLRAGESVAVTAAAGSVGQMLLRLLRLAGAGQVIGAVGSAAKTAAARSAGADVVIDCATEPLAERLRAATNGVGVDVIFESVGKETLAQAAAALAPFGRMVVFGESGGAGPGLEVGPLYVENRSVVGFSGRPFRTRFPVATRRVAERVLRAVADGTLDLPAPRAYPLEGAAEAHRALESRTATGKLILVP
jgi:NADPH:quinone reductase